MAEINKDEDRLQTTQDSGFTSNWSWKDEYVSKLAEDGYERFSQYSATPDTTVVFAGPARFTGLSGDSADLLPIGLVDGIGFQTNPSLARLYEIGSNRAFFTRGKTVSSISFSKMLADQKNILNALAHAAYRPAMTLDGGKAPGADSPNPDIMMNLDSEYFSVPFGLMLLFKTRGGGNGNGKILAATYLEYCMFANYNFSIQATSPVIQEAIAIEFDRTVPVSLTN